jgi:hypothetical protein
MSEYLISEIMLQGQCLLTENQAVSSLKYSIFPILQQLLVCISAFLL